MNLCMCGCGAEVKNRYVRGHQWLKKMDDSMRGAEQTRRTLEKIDALELAVKLPTSLTGPPAWPASIDRSRWRLAEDRPGTPVANPWIETKCHSCLERMWTKDPLSTWDRGGMCEECSWIAREDFGKEIIKRNSGPYDPFV